ncbi:hypothetical protein WJX82_007908 [Trebouxia sp. C0006]
MKRSRQSLQTLLVLPKARKPHAVKIHGAALATLHLPQPSTTQSEVSGGKAESHPKGVASSPEEQAALERPTFDLSETVSHKPALLYIKAQTEEAEGPVTVVFRRALSVDNSSSRDRPASLEQSGFELQITLSPGAPYAFTGQHWLNQDSMVPSLEAKLWLFTKSGMVYPVAVQKLPAESKISDEANIEQILPLANGDEVVEVMLIPSKPSKEEIVVLVTAAGLMTKLPLERLTEQIGEADNMKPFKCITLQAGDAVGWVITPILAGDFDDLALNPTLGVSSTWNDSRVVGLAVVPTSTADSASGRQHIAHLHMDILVVTERGFAKRVPLAEFPEQKEGQKGMKAISLDVGDSLVAMHAFTFPGAKPADSECIVALSSKGNATKRLMTTVPVFARAAAGHHLLKMQEGGKIARVLRAS